MIPKRAFFYWGGKKMPWIRRVSVDSFKQLNPDWEVTVFDDDPSIPADTVVKRSDIFRYGELAARGGWYFDTDILFIRPMCSLLQTLGDADTVVNYEMREEAIRIVYSNGRSVVTTDTPFWFSVASLACVSGNAFFGAAYESAVKFAGSPDGQSCGVCMMTERFGSFERTEEEFSQHRFHRLPKKTFLPADSTKLRDLYRSGSNLESAFADPDVYGVHWFGGDHIGQLADAWTPKNYWKDCPLGSVLAELA